MSVLKSLPRFFIIGNLIILLSWFAPYFSCADDTLMDGTPYSRQYLLQASGTVLNETFSGARVVLTLMPPTAGVTHPYLLIIVGYPTRSSRNSFYWNGDDSEMTGVANQITCEIKQTFIKPASMHFFFMSPELLSHTGAAFEGKAFALKTARPTRIEARAGKLQLRVSANAVSGTVWMKGYDPIEKSFVRYSAQLYGQKSQLVVPK